MMKHEPRLDPTVGLLEAWLPWMILSGLGWPISLVLASLAARAFSLDLTNVAALAYAGLLGGALLGLIEWMFLHQVAHGPARLALATAVGWTGALTVIASVATLGSSVWIWVAGGFIGGLVQGALHGLALKAGCCERKRAWPLLTGASWGAAVGLSRLLSGAGTGDPAAASYTAAVGWPVLAVLSVVVALTLTGRPGKAEGDRHIRYWP